MKLFNAIAAAAVISTSFIAANPAEARNGWIYQGQTRDGNAVYYRPKGCNGAICNYEDFHSNWEKPIANKVDCNRWQIIDSRGRYDIMPRSNGEAKAEQMCR